MQKDKEAIFITQWKNEMKERIKLRFKDKPLNDKKIDAYLNEKIKEYMVNPPLQIVNNYREAVVNTDLLSLIDTIEENQLIIGGGGVLFVQHDTPNKKNVLFDYIVNLQNKRNGHKKARKQYEKNSDGWIREDIFQLNTKTKILQMAII